MPPQQFCGRRRRHIVKPVQQPHMPGQARHPDFDSWRRLGYEPSGCLVARLIRRGGDGHHRAGDMGLPASEDPGSAARDRSATSGGTIQRRDPAGTAAGARQRMRCHATVEQIRDGHATFPASSPQTTSMHRASFDESPLKPRRVEAQFKTRRTITQFGRRPCQCRVAVEKTESVTCGRFRNLKNAGEPGWHKPVGPPNVYAFRKCFVSPDGNEACQGVQRQPVEQREFRQPHPHRLAVAAPLGSGGVARWGGACRQHPRLPEVVDPIRWCGSATDTHDGVRCSAPCDRGQHGATRLLRHHIATAFDHLVPEQGVKLQGLTVAG